MRITRKTRMWILKRGLPFLDMRGVLGVIGGNDLRERLQARLVDRHQVGIPLTETPSRHPPHGCSPRAPARAFSAKLVSSASVLLKTLPSQPASLGLVRLTDNRDLRTFLYTLPISQGHQHPPRCPPPFTLALGFAGISHNNQPDVRLDAARMSLGCRWMCGGYAHGCRTDVAGCRWMCVWMSLDVRLDIARISHGYCDTPLLFPQRRKAQGALPTRKSTGIPAAFRSSIDTTTSQKNNNKTTQTPPLLTWASPSFVSARTCRPCCPLRRRGAHCASRRCPRCTWRTHADRPHRSATRTLT